MAFRLRVIDRFIPELSLRRIRHQWNFDWFHPYCFTSSKPLLRRLSVSVLKCADLRDIKLESNMGSLVKDDVAPAKEQEDPTGITSDLKQVVEGLRNNFEAGLMSMEFRRVQLKRMRDMLLEQTDRFAAATNADLGKPYHEFYVAEVLVTLNELDDMLRNMDSYSADATVSKSQATFMDNLRIQQSPLGVVLIIGAWNYPVSLMLLPALGAIAAGNCVLLKPSEVAPETARAVKEALETYMDQRCCRVVLGGVEETTKLLEERYDHIFFTGSHTVGKIVYQAAAKNLTPCILELGGKNPCYIDSSVDMPKAVRRILGGKTLNAGQTCVAPDYLLCTREVKERFLAQVPEVLREWYPNGTKGSPDYTRLINDRHFQRVKNLIHSGGKIVIGGETDAETRYVAPTIIDYVSLEDPIMKEEVFGPVLPIIEVESVQEALRIVKEREKPLTTYVFSTKDDVINMFKHKTSSGCLVVNETVLHFAVDSLPFGGVGTSGLGKYHGKASFDAFVNKRAILHKSYNPLLEMGGGFRYPPYTNMKLPWARALLLKWWLPLPSRFACAVAALSFVVYQYLQLQNRCETE